MAVECHRTRCIDSGVTTLAVVLVPSLPHETFAAIRTLWRGRLAVVLLVTAIFGLRKRQPDRLLTFAVVLAVAVSQFSGELAALGAPYIWFPFDTGASLTQYAYAAIIVGLAVLLIHTAQRAQQAATSVRTLIAKRSCQSYGEVLSPIRGHAPPCGPRA